MHRNTMLKEDNDMPSGAPVRSFFGGSSFHPFAMMQHTMRDMSRQFSQLEREMDSFFNFNSIDSGFPRRLPALDNRIGGPDAMMAPSTPAFKQEIVTEGDQNKYNLNVYLGQNFPPENIKVTQKDHVLTIEAKTEKTSEDGHSRMYQEVSRKFTLPDNVDMKELKSNLLNGVLKIEAPVPTLALPEPPKPIEIPVHML